MLHLVATAGNGSFTHPELPTLQTLLDSTSIGTFKECPLKYFYQVVCGLRSNRPADPLVFGSAFHRAMEIYHYGRAKGQEHTPAIVSALKAGIKAYTNRDGTLYQAVKKERGFYALCRAIVWHLDTFNGGGYKPDEAKTVLLDDGTPAAELSFRFHFYTDEDGIEYSLCGHFDHLVEFSGRYFVKDYKTTANLGPQFFSNFNPDNQMTLYTIAGKVVLNRPVAGVIIDGIQTAVNFNRFQRGFVYKTPEVLEEWIEDLKFWISIMKQAATQGHYPQNDKSCDKYGGCPYRDVCNTPPSLRDNIIESHYHRDIWDPSVPREEDRVV